MKFARDFDVSLKEGDYPEDWLQTAISYRQLKKCIKLVQRELQDVGLEPEVLEQLWQHAGKHDETSTTVNGARTNGDCSQKVTEELSQLNPKLTVVVDPRDGSPIDAWLSPETKQFLVRFSKLNSEQLSAPEPTTEIDVKHPVEASSAPLFISRVHQEGLLKRRATEFAEEVQTIEIPLSSGTEFFRILRQELNGLGKLQETQQTNLNTQIVQLGEQLTHLTQPGNRKSKTELNAWREIFRQYLDAQVFFSTLEKGAGYQTSIAAQRKLEAYGQTLEANRKSLKLSEKGRAALVTFLQINSSLLQSLKYQELNRVALTKILKKFDKRTTLLHLTQPNSMTEASAEIPRLLTGSNFVAQNVAKSACATIHSTLLPVVPQLTDYLCPVCLSIAFKPIRLRCDHVFCIRCIILLKRQKKDHCPMCRDGTVLLAGSDNLDITLMAFLKEKFPSEVKNKHSENRRAAGDDERYKHGNESFEQCAVM